MKKRKSRYRLNNNYWYQTELTYAEDTSVRHIVRDSGFQMPMNDEAFPDIVDKLYTEKPDMFKQLIAVILKIETKGWRGLWNKLHRPIDAYILADRLTKGEIAVVLADFFTMRLKWMYDLLNSKGELALQKKFQRQMGKTLNQLKHVSTSLDKTMSEQKK